ncbi:MAG TPA: hypothetical protein VGD45_26690 [Steroidobacter sp.]|uniref:hypothetical protein n=1 Tax=Steroidobacter sp. TaxID=1978227 RepID=UPI002ED815B2
MNLEVLALMFAKRGSQDLEHWTGAASESVYGRRLAFLYEWLTGESLPFEVSSKASYVPVVDRTIQFGLTTGVRNSRFRVIDNLPGNRKFCPLVRRSVMTH